LRILSFAKTGTALLSVTIATVSGIDRPDDRDGRRAWRSDAACVRSHGNCSRRAPRRRRSHVKRRVVRNGGASLRLPGMRSRHPR
jgi:hypothetical protein